MKKITTKDTTVYHPPISDGFGGHTWINSIAGPTFISKNTVVEIKSGLLTGLDGTTYFITDKGNLRSDILKDYTPLVEQAKLVEIMAWIGITFFVILFVFAWVLIIRKK